MIDLGHSPLCESFLTPEQTREPETHYPLKALVCHKCYLVQLEAYVDGREIFGHEYAYFSSFSSSWLQHAKSYVESIVRRLGLDSASQVIELASNDGYLLKNFVDRGIPALGIEPAPNVAEAAREKGVTTRTDFFTEDLAIQLENEGMSADLVVANNVLAHVPDLNDFVGGIKRVLKPTGTATIEFPHLMSQMLGNQFDTIYQEHYCYFSLFALQSVFARYGLQVFDLDHLSTHGGSLRVYVTHANRMDIECSDRVDAHLKAELEFGMSRLETYRGFALRTIDVKNDLLEFLINARRMGKRVAAYGAPGKGNTFLNYCGIRRDLIRYTVDRNPYKHGRFLPGSHIPVHSPDHIRRDQPDVIVILPWNLREEISEQLAYTRAWNAQLVVAIPELTIL